MLDKIFNALFDEDEIIRGEFMREKRKLKLKFLEKKPQRKVVAKEDDFKIIFKECKGLNVSEREEFGRAIINARNLR